MAQTWIDAYDEFAELVDEGRLGGTCAVDVADLRQLLKLAKAAQAYVAAVEGPPHDGSMLTAVAPRYIALREALSGPGRE